MLLNKLQLSLSKLPKFKRVVVGVSGGADSVALADLLIRSNYDVTIAHLNHGLRGVESDSDEQFVIDFAKTRNIPIVSERVDIDKSGNLENNSRTVRYEFLESVRQTTDSDYIAVGHHRDDQIETVFMHMQRGAGLRGMGGMSPISGNVIRPMLDISKSEIVEYLSSRNISYRTDSSNSDNSFQRNNLRNVIIPALKDKYPDFEENILMMSNLARRKLSDINKIVDIWSKKYLTGQSFNRLAFLSLSSDAQSEVLFSLAGHKDIYRHSIEKAKDLINNGLAGKRAIVGNISFEINCKSVAYFETNTERKMQPTCKLGSEPILWDKWQLSCKSGIQLSVRSWKPGDRFRPVGMNGSKKLQDFFVDEKVPRHQRNNIPIIVDEHDNIVAVGNMRVAEGFNRDNISVYEKTNINSRRANCVNSSAVGQC